MYNKKFYMKLFVLCLILNYILSTNYAFAQSPQQDRLFGSDRYKTAVAISQKGWPSGSNYVVLARGDDFADALCAGPLAKKYDAPILLTSSNEIDNSVLAEIKRLGAKNIYIIGGTGAVSQNVEDALKESGLSNIERIWGSDRYETSVRIAEKLDVVSKIVIATGADFPDALSISAIASNLGMPIILTEQGKLSDSVKQYISGKTIIKTYIIGGTGVISESVEGFVPSPVRLGGKGRFETNALVLAEFADDLDFSMLYIAVGDGPNGDEFADALSGAVLAAKTSSPVLLSYKTLPSVIGEFIKTKASSDSKIIALGGVAVVPETVVNSLIDYVNNAAQPANPPAAGAPAGGGAPAGSGNPTSSPVTVQNVQVVTYDKQNKRIVIRSDLQAVKNGNDIEIDMSSQDDLTQLYGFQVTVDQACRFKISTVDNPYLEGFLNNNYTGQDLIAGTPGNSNIVRIDDIIYGTNNDDGVSLKTLRENGADAAIFNGKLIKDGNETSVRVYIKIK